MNTLKFSILVIFIFYRMIAIFFHFFCDHIEDSVCIFFFLNKAVNLPCEPVTT